MKLFFCFWSNKSLKNGQATSLFFVILFLEAKVERKYTARYMLCHRTEVAKDFQCCTTDCGFFCNAIGRGKFLSSNETRGISRTSPDPLLLWVGFWHETTRTQTGSRKLTFGGLIYVIAYYTLVKIHSYCMSHPHPDSFWTPSTLACLHLSDRRHRYSILTSWVPLSSTAGYYVNFDLH